MVLPAPLGPMSAVIALRGTSRCSMSTAVRPPKVRRMPSAMMIGSTFSTPGLASPTCNPVDFGRALSGVTAVVA